MALDTRQKRMAAVNMASPWRGPMVDPTESGFSVSNRGAAAYMYAANVQAVANKIPLTLREKPIVFTLKTRDL